MVVQYLENLVGVSVEQLSNANSEQLLVYAMACGLSLLCTVVLTWGFVSILRGWK